MRLFSDYIYIYNMCVCVYYFHLNEGFKKLQCKPQQ